MHFFDFLLALTCNASWSLNIIATKVGVLSVTPLGFIIMRALLCSPLLFFVPKPKMSWKHLFAISFGFGIFMNGFMALGIYLGVSASAATLIMQSGAFFLVILSSIFLKLHPRPQHIIGMIVGFLGIAYVTMEDGFNFNIWASLSVMMAAFSWAFSVMLIKASDTTEYFNLSVWSTVLPLGPLFIVFVIFDNPVTLINHAIAIHDLYWWCAIYSGLFASIIFGGAWNYLTRKYHPALIAPFQLVIPILGVLFGWLLLKEEISPNIMIGGCLVLIGLSINQGLIERIIRKIKYLLSFKSQ